MEGYKPRKPSFFRQMISSPFLYVLVVFGLVFGTVYFIRKKQNEELVSRIEFLKSGPVIVDKKDNVAATETTPSSTETPASAPPPPVGVETSASSPPPHNPSATTDHVPPATAPPQPTTMAAGGENIKPARSEDQDDNLTATGSDTIKLKVVYAEVEKDAKDEFTSEMFTLPRAFSFGDMQVGLIRNLDSKLKRQRSVHILERITKVFSPNKMSHQWFLGSRDGEYELGLTTMVTLEGVENGSVKGEVELLRSFRESPDSPPVKKSFPVSAFEVPARHAWMMIAQIPRVNQDDPNDPNHNGIMQVFHSPSFQNKKSEFTLFLEFDTPRSNLEEGARNESGTPQRN
ncbi:MAG: hypothetical protein BroJett040_05000 [Oligoflexia bacterium]|nr:MAG: hypothetical protein BroJett040_05000 [Oligoflexia bacterium]